MKLTRISLTNFRSFKETQTLELAPVTLLFGPNSVGKSSVLMALAYVQEILTSGQCNPLLIEATNKKVGGFSSLVYGNDLASAIVIKLEYVVGNSIFENYRTHALALARALGEKFLALENIDENISSCAIEFEIVWSEKWQEAYVKSYRVWLNKEYFGTVTSSSDRKNTFISDFNTEHSLFAVEHANWDWLDADDIEFYYRHQEHQHDAFMRGTSMSAMEQPPKEILSRVIAESLNDTNPNSRVSPEQSERVRLGINNPNIVSPISVRCASSGAVPLLGCPINTDLVGDFDDGSSENLSYLMLQAILSQGFVLPLDNLKNYLANSIFIGPLRVMPDVDFVANPYPRQSDWSDGTAAWDILHKYPTGGNQTERLLKQVNEWLVSEEKLNTGYELVNKSISDVSSMGEAFPEAFNYQLERRHLLFTDKNTDIALNVSQLGTGISQMLPLIVAAHMESAGVISIEQPELHIHPRWQTVIGDLLLLSTQKSHDEKLFFIETHSEHLILRLLRRIRESESGELLKLIQVLYLSPSQNGVQVEEMQVTSDGDFTNDWPEGFFDERDEELF